ncbi:LLM class F420-dependent oxidoreductase [Humibacter sp. BT305]|nr:LLM class F420-dependent oxidoreductase [Humibacter sp. BT305]
MTTPSRPVRVGVQLAPQHHSSYAEIRDAVVRLEDMGIDVLFNWDHFFPLSGDPEGTHFEGWSMLAAWAEQTSRVQFGPLVTCNSYRNPELLADMARTVDHISKKDGDTGRLIFGIGSGWFERDYVEYGYDFGTVGSRLDALAEDLPRIESRWSKLNPQPTRHIPVLIGGGGEKKTLRLVAKHADIWHSFSDVETLNRKLAVLDEWCAKEGRDRSEIEISTAVRADSGGDYSTLDAQLEAGVTLFTLSITAPDLDFAAAESLVRWRDSL